MTRVDYIKVGLKQTEYYDNEDLAFNEANKLCENENVSFVEVCEYDDETKELLNWIILKGKDTCLRCNEI